MATQTTLVPRILITTGGTFFQIIANSTSQEPGNERLFALIGQIDVKRFSPPQLRVKLQTGDSSSPFSASRRFD